jgi:hypothetical protein
VASILVLKRASASRPSGEWSEDDCDVLADGVVVGRIMLANAAPVDAPWMWTLRVCQELAAGGKASHSVSDATRHTDNDGIPRGRLAISAARTVGTGSVLYRS